MIDIGSVINGKYRLVRLVGDGGMGSVYEGLHLVLATRVAIKVLHPDLARRTGLVERFLQEARVAAQIRSPHVVQVTDVDRTSDGHAYIVMELLEGEPLSAVLDRQRRLPAPTACEYTSQILEALEAAHALGVIHRDLKPENVFVTFAGGKPVLKLIDFGIAKARRTDPQQKNLTVAGVVMGTAEYMAPEQARSADKVDARSDIYAVGVMLYEMIAGARPVSGDDARIIALKVERGEITPLVQRMPDVPRELAGLVHRAMAARPELRFASATEMRLAVDQAASGKRGAPAAPPQTGVASPAAELTATGTLKNVSAAQVLGPAARPVTAPTPQFAPAMGGSGDAADRAPQTERAPPIATAMASPGVPPGMMVGMAGVGMGPPRGMPPPGSPGGFPAEPRRSRGRGQRATVFALVTLSLMLGAGVVAMLISSGTLSLSGDPPDPGPAPQPAPPTTEAGGGAPTPPPSPTPIPTLSTGRPTSAPPPGPGPHPAPSNRPVPVEDAGAEPLPFVFPTTLPSTLPPMPSFFPLPSGFPTTIPSIFPPWPPAPAPAPPHGSTL